MSTYFLSPDNCQAKSKQLSGERLTVVRRKVNKCQAKENEQQRPVIYKVPTTKLISMSVYYDLYENPQPNNDDTQPVLLHPRVIPRGTLDQEQFLKIVSQTNGFSQPILAGTLQAITDQLQRWLADGWNVELGDLGYFSLSLRCDRPILKKSEVRSPSIHFGNVNLRLSQKYRKMFNNLELERMTSPYVSHSTLNEKECLQIVDKYLETHPFMTRADYQRLTGKSKDKSNKELNAFIQQGAIQKYGSGRMVVYIKKI